MNETTPLPLPEPRIQTFERLDGQCIQSAIDEVAQEFKDKARSRSFLHKFVSWLFWTLTDAADTDVLLDSVVEGYMNEFRKSQKLTAEVEKLNRTVSELKDSQALICNKLAEATDSLTTAEKRASCWEQSAGQFSADRDYYRGLVVAVGELFGKPAFTSDDGSVQQDVLCAKVPELVKQLVTNFGQVTDDLIAARQDLTNADRTLKTWKQTATVLDSERNAFWKKLVALRKRRQTQRRKAKKAA